MGTLYHCLSSYSFGVYIGAGLSHQSKDTNTTSAWFTGSQGDYIPYGPYQTWDLRFRKKSLCQLVEDMEAQGLEEQDVIVRDLFDGGETVYYRVYDEDGNMIP